MLHMNDGRKQDFFVTTSQGPLQAYGRAVSELVRVANAKMC